MTARALHEQAEPTASYEGGFDTAEGACHVSVRNRSDCALIDVHLTVYGDGICSAAVHHRFSLADAREFALALEKAADAAEGWREVPA